MELTKYKLGDVCTFINGRAYSQPELLDSGKYKVLRVGNIFDGNHWYYSDMELEEDKYCNEGDLLYSWACTFGPYIWHGPKTIYHYHIWKVKQNDSLVDKSFLYYFLNHQTKGFMGSTHGSTMIHITKENMENFEVLLPSLKDQKKIASVLSALDDKIALNKKMNQKLETMAKRLYDYWFVQYDFPDKNGLPYKTTGGKMEYNPTLKREIPEGWEVVQFQDLCTVKRGASPRPIDDFMDESKQGMPWVKISDATSCDSPFLIQIKEFIIKDGISKSIQVKPATLIVSNSASPGIPKFIQIDACVHDGWLVILDYEESYKYYLYYTIQMLRYNLLNMANGSIFKNLKTDYLKEYDCINPPKEVLNAFHNGIKKYMDLILHIEKETIKLIALRDKLLPLLMNGQVKI